MNDVKLFYILVQAANNGMYKVLHVDAVPFTNSLIALRDSTSGNCPFGFWSFENTKNPLKIQKTSETGNFETYVLFRKNLT